MQFTLECLVFAVQQHIAIPPVLVFLPLPLYIEKSCPARTIPFFISFSHLHSTSLPYRDQPSFAFIGCRITVRSFSTAVLLGSLR